MQLVIGARTTLYHAITYFFSGIFQKQTNCMLQLLTQSTTKSLQIFSSSTDCMMQARPIYASSRRSSTQAVRHQAGKQKRESLFGHLARSVCERGRKREQEQSRNAEQARRKPGLAFTSTQQQQQKRSKVGLPFLAGKENCLTSKDKLLSRPYGSRCCCCCHISRLFYELTFTPLVYIES